MKAECGKTARSVWAADGGKPFNGRLLRPDIEHRKLMVGTWMATLQAQHSPGSGRIKNNVFP
jgi:hypothetical protein